MIRETVKFIKHLNDFLLEKRIKTRFVKNMKNACYQKVATWNGAKSWKWADGSRRLPKKTVDRQWELMINAVNEAGADALYCGFLHANTPESKADPKFWTNLAKEYEQRYVKDLSELLIKNELKKEDISC